MKQVPENIQIDQEKERETKKTLVGESSNVSESAKMKMITEPKISSKVLQVLVTQGMLELGKLSS